MDGLFFYNVDKKSIRIPEYRGRPIPLEIKVEGPERGRKEQENGWKKSTMD
ncbi:MAG: hypothetical protein K2N24_07470 [Lachnospiraceae bacterium]|nr:hypothetical protein [Lachnospiraceae bacterium]